MTGTKKCRISVPILAVITAATLLSTFSSLAGGLIIYYQGIESLEDAVKQTSASELLSLRQGVLGIDDQIVESFGVIKTFFFAGQQVDSDDTADWNKQLASFMFAQVNSSEIIYYVAIALHVFQPQALAHDHIYCSVWSDEWSNGTRTMTLGEYGPHLKDGFYNATKPARKLAPTWALNREGKQTEFLGIWNASIDGYAENLIDYNIDPREDVLKDGYEHATLVKGAHSERFRDIRLYHSPEAERPFLYGYSNIDAVYFPPAAPHRWNKFRAARVSVGYLSSAYTKVFSKFSTLEADETTIFLVNRANGRVYGATTPGFSVVPAECQLSGMKSEEATNNGCFSNVTHHFDDRVRDAFTEMADEEDGAFVKKSVGGESHFIGRRLVRADMELIWMRPVSTVDGEVREALTLLIIFVCLVLVFDTSISVLEVFFIAFPLRNLATSIQAIGNMETEDAAFAIKSYEAKCLMVTEIRKLIQGMGATVSRLEEFRTFMPEVVLGKLDTEDDTVDEATPNGSHMTMTSASRTSHKSSMGTSRTVEGVQSNLALHLGPNRPISLLALNVVKWSETVCKGEEVVSRHSDLVTSVLGIMQHHGGCVEIFQGDRFLLAWGGIRRHSDTALKCLTCALHCNDKISNLSAAVASGKARSGNMGNNQLRRATLISPVVPWVVYLENFNKASGTKVTTDTSVTLTLANYFLFRVVEGVANKSGAVIPLSTVVKKLETQQTEWMYQLEEAQGMNEYAADNAFATSVIKEDWSSIHALPSKNDVLHKFYIAYENKRFVPLKQFYIREDCQ